MTTEATYTVPPTNELLITICEHDDETVGKLLREGKALLIGGILVLNEGSTIAKIVRVIKAQAAQNPDDLLRGIRGWIFIVGDTSVDGLHYVNSGYGNAESTILDIAMTSVPCFVSIINKEIVEKHADRQQLLKAIEFAMGFIE